MKCPYCVEGKVLPLIPLPTMKQVENCPDCDNCNGTGIYEPDKKLVEEGKRLRELRKSSRTTLREFCIVHELDSVEISKIERGVKEATPDIVNIYEGLQSITKYDDPDLPY